MPLYLEPLILLYALVVSFINTGFRHAFKFIAVCSFLYAISILSYSTLVFENHTNTAQLMISSLFAYIMGNIAAKSVRSVWYDLFAVTMLMVMLNNLMMLNAFYFVFEDYYVMFLVFNEYVEFLLSLVSFLLIIRIAHDGGPGDVVSNRVRDIFGGILAFFYREEVERKARASLWGREKRGAQG